MHNNFSSQIYRIVAKHCPELQALYFSEKCPKDERVRKNVLHLTKLKNLTRLKLNCSWFSLCPLIDEFSKASTRLTELNFNFDFGTVDMQLLVKLSNLKSSSVLQFGIKRRVTNDIVMKLPDLVELDIDT